MVWRLDNYLGSAEKENMCFWDYADEGPNDVKKKSWVSSLVAKSHYVFRNYMGSVDQSDAKSHVMGLARERVEKWSQKQLAFLVEAAIICSNGNFNLEPRFKPQTFSEYHTSLIAEFIDLSKNYRKYKVSTPIRGKRKYPGSGSIERRSHKSRRRFIILFIDLNI